MYKVKFYEGSHRSRQNDANADDAICYVIQHLNAAASQSANYALVVVGTNASNKSKEWGRWYAKRVAKEFGTKVGGDKGILVGGYRGRGNSHVYYTNMPAVLLEPMFCSNPEQADILRSEEGQKRLAKCLVESIKQFFPEGGLVAFSVGHKYNPGKPNDRGASLHGGGTEADHAEKILKKAAKMLEGAPAEPVPASEVLSYDKAKILLEARLNASIAPNELASAMGITDPKLIRVIEVGMYLAACAAFERFIFDITGKRHPKETFRKWLRTNDHDEMANNFEAYWNVRNAMIHGAGHCGTLDIWASSAEHSDEIRKILTDDWSITKETDLYDPNAFDMGNHWSGLVGYVRKMADKAREM